MKKDSLLSVWSRRLVSIPAYLGLFVVWMATLAIWIPGGMLLDLVAGKAHLLPRTRALVFFTLYLWCELLGVIGAAVTWLFHFGGRRLGQARYREANAELQRYWTHSLFYGALKIFSMRLDVVGLEHVTSGPLLLFVRHSSVADTVLTAALVANPHRLLLRYVLKRELLWDPCLDIVGRRLPNAFVERTKPRSHGEIAAIAALAEQLDARSAVLIYPEGTRYSPVKLEAALGALRLADKQELLAIAESYRNVLPPRLGGPLALLEAAPKVDIAFVEHTGFEGAASFSKFWSGTLIKRTIHIRLRRIAAADIPATGRDRWLFEQWAELDQWIEQFVDLPHKE